LERASSFSFKRSTDALLERAASLRRITYALWCGAVGQHRSAIRSAVLEAVVEALQAVEQDESSIGVGEGASTLLSSVFLCMRAIALRITERNLVPFWPLATAELLRVLAADSRYAGDAGVVQSAHKLLSLLRILRPAAFAAFVDMFAAPFATQAVSLTDTKEADMTPATAMENAHLERTRRVQQLKGHDELALPEHNAAGSLAEEELSIVQDLCSHPAEALRGLA
jgi:hypothetical protein